MECIFCLELEFIDLESVMQRSIPVQWNAALEVLQGFCRIGMPCERSSLRRSDAHRHSPFRLSISSTSRERRNGDVLSVCKRSSSFAVEVTDEFSVSSDGSVVQRGERKRQWRHEVLMETQPGTPDDAGYGGRGAFKAVRGNAPHLTPGSPCVCCLARRSSRLSLCTKS